LTPRWSVTGGAGVDDGLGVEVGSWVAVGGTGVSVAVGIGVEVSCEGCAFDGMQADKRKSDTR
jgi:hypothetical protein